MDGVFSACLVVDVQAPAIACATSSNYFGLSMAFWTPLGKLSGLGDGLQ